MKEVNTVSHRGFLISAVTAIVGIVALGTGSTGATVQDSGTGSVRISTTDDFPGVDPTPVPPEAQDKSTSSRKAADDKKKVLQPSVATTVSPKPKGSPEPKPSAPKSTKPDSVVDTPTAAPSPAPTSEPAPDLVEEEAAES